MAKSANSRTLSGYKNFQPNLQAGNPRPPARRAGTVDPIEISSTMTSNEIFNILGNHECPDVTLKLEVKNCGTTPVRHGGFGDIYEGRLVTGEKVAIKCARLFVVSTEGFAQTTKTLARELYSWSKCRHDNVLELHGIARFNNQLAIVSPWMDNDTLPYFIEKNPGVNVHKLCYQVSSGVAYLHRNNTVHGDIKGANVLITSTGMAKLSDFGNTVIGDRSLRFTGSSSQSLSLRWTAPELLNGGVSFSKEADVYALGMTILEAITKNVPFPEKSDQAVIVDLLRQKCPTRSEVYFPSSNDQSNRIWALLEGCWTIAQLRLTAAEVEAQLKALLPCSQTTDTSL